MSKSVLTNVSQLTPLEDGQPWQYGTGHEYQRHERRQQAVLG